MEDQCRINTFGRAPVELAVAAAHRVRAPLVHAQAAFVAQPAAAAPLPRGEPVRVLHALPALGAVQAQAGVPPAVVRGVLQVEELRLRDAAERVHHGAPVVRAVAGAHALSVHVQLLRLVVLAPQVVADLPEVGQLRPAGLDAAALRHAVTSADALHRRLHCLLETTVNHPHPRFRAMSRGASARTYQPPRRVVVQVDSGPGVLPRLLRVHVLSSPVFPFLETSQPQLSRSPRLQFRVRVYMTPAALMAWTKEVSLVADDREKRQINL
ncbi:hypothetical protein EYF80_060218 [Liparis tanakae]|uniref:Uncharacterized protein n=1 Tax=Liparis tanakae TaxID=230148 RepID=A0A4Z2EL73_9TELE|nr:hypothetical protein EYF80_060218 [Liparis tanakae]